MDTIWEKKFTYFGKLVRYADNFVVLCKTKKEALESIQVLHWSMEEMIKGLNRKIRGLRNYYSVSPIVKRWLNRIDWYILERLNLFWNKKWNKRHKHTRISEIIQQTKDTILKLAA